MRTSEEIYHRIRWDPRFDPARFLLGINVRGAPPKRVPLPAFVPGGDIPWHRVLFVEADGEVVWDRRAGVDRVDSSPAGRAREARRLRAPFFAARTPVAWDPAAGWRPAEADAPGRDRGSTARPAPDASGPTAATTPIAADSITAAHTAAGGPAAAAGTAPARLRVLTWNTLWDRYDADRIDTARRRPLLLAALERADADVIALQEVEAGLLDLLLRAPWVRAGYTLGTDPAGPDVDETGLLLLSRLPVREAGLHVLGPHKGVAAVTVEFGGGTVVVAATHLTSDHTENGAARREAELTRLAELPAHVDGEVVLLGDFNDGDDGLAGVLGARDAWTEVHGPGDRTVTFDPAANPLAAVSSLSGRASRLDRVFLGGSVLRATTARLTGDSPMTPDGLFASDHYGVVVDVSAGAGPEPAAPLVVPAADDAPARTVAERLRACLAEGLVEVVGSRRMECAPAGADLDLVAVLPGTPDPADVRRRVTAALPEAAGVRHVTGARVPGLRFRSAGLAVDLMVVAAGDLAPAEAVARRTDLGETSAIALSAVSDADAVLASVAGHRDRFSGLARTVKAWARVRGLDSAPFGGLPGLAWAVLAARTVREAAEDLPPGDLLRHFFGTWAAWDWRRPVVLRPEPRARDASAVEPSASGASAAERSAASAAAEERSASDVAAPERPVAEVAAPDPAAPPAVRVMTPTAPVRSCTGQVGPGVRDLLTRELYRAWEILEEGENGGDPPAALLSPPPMHRRHAAWAVVTVRRTPVEEFGVTLGRARGRVRALLSGLEDAGIADAHAWPRPFETGPEATRFAVGLGRTPPDAARLAAIAGPWASTLRGVTVAWAPCGEVPPLP
ncbi:poly(A) polymerase [Actinoallomurus rhizosphaericola]|uniref:poly(A) polymerase n=1 Tax=Actinoallomurus rhizosphaericola TaxID=2952536 RepID=UPI0020937EED|nr:poly(A) polymerase [Actinoallomurus rhizosphaericola]MCO5998223.1 RNA repair domain-containing protein [Actinoallomurus rhizosphaericola]